MKISLNPDGSAQVNNTDEGKTNADGSAAHENWSVGAGQLEAHLRGLPQTKTGEHPWRNASAGDKTAARDAAAQYAAKLAEAAKSL